MSESGIRMWCLATTRVRGEFEDKLREEEQDVTDSKQECLDEAEEYENSERNRGCRHTSKSPSIKDDSVTDSSSDAGSSVLSNHSSIHPKILPTTAPQNYASCFQEAQLSPDGTCIFTTDSTRRFSVYPIDPTILSSEPTPPRPLAPYAQFRSADPIWSFAINPYFDLQDASTTTILISRRDQYISLHNALWDITKSYTETDTTESHQPHIPINISPKITSYKLVSTLTEAVLAPSSLTYSHSATHFYAGHRNTISIFDMTYPDAPLQTIPTIPSTRSKLKGGGRGFKGHITALALSPASTYSRDGILAAGSRTRYVGLYDGRSGDEVTHFALPGALKSLGTSNVNTSHDSTPTTHHVKGGGLTQLKWSPCGTYLYLAERKTNTLLIYDARNFSLTLGYCVGRKAVTNQKLGFDIWANGDDVYGSGSGGMHEIWAGGTDGKVRVWRDPWKGEGAVEADEVLGDDEGVGIHAPVIACLVHQSGSLGVFARGACEVDEKEEGVVERKIGMERGGHVYPRRREWGSLDIVGLGSG